MHNINEIFETIQGEGHFTGIPSIFIRLQGCPVGCSWCDTKHSWFVNEENRIPFKELVNENSTLNSWGQASESEILNFLAKKFTARHIVITGGEPCIYDLTSLTESLESQGYFCQIETSGTFEVKASSQSWVTLSPKINMKGKLKLNHKALSRANEIKHPIGTHKDIANLKNILASNLLKQQPKVYLQPISQKDRATKLCVQECIKNNWNLSIQVHKYINID